MNFVFSLHIYFYLQVLHLTHWNVLASSLTFISNIQLQSIAIPHSMPTEVFHNVDCFIEHGLLPAHQLPEDVTDCSICATPYNTDCTIPVYTACGHL